MKKKYAIILIFVFIRALNLDVYAAKIKKIRIKDNENKILVGQQKNDKKREVKIKNIVKGFKRKGYIVNFKKVYLSVEKKFVDVLHLKNIKYGAEFNFVLCDTKQEYEKFLNYGVRMRVSFFDPTLNDIGGGHALEHLISEGIVHAFEEKNKGKYTTLSYGCSSRSEFDYFVNSTRYFNHLDVNFDCKYLDVENLKIVLNHLKHPSFLEDKDKLFKREVHDSFNGKPIGRMYVEQKDLKELQSIYFEQIIGEDILREYNRGGEPEEILKLTPKEVKEDFKKYINPYNMCVSSCCLNDEAKINEILTLFENEYFSAFDPKKNQDKADFLKIPLKDNAGYKEYFVNKNDLGFRKSVDDKIEESYSNFAGVLNYDLDSLGLSYEEKSVLNFLYLDYFEDIIARNFKEKGYHLKFIRNGKYKFKLGVITKNKSLLKKEKFLSNLKLVLTDLKGKIEKLTQFDIENILTNSEKSKDKKGYSYSSLNIRDANHFLDLMRENRYDYGDSFSKKGFSPIIFSNKISKKCAARLLFKNLKSAFSKIEGKEPIIDVFYPDLNKEYRYFIGDFNIPIYIKEFKNNRSLLMISEDLLIKNIIENLLSKKGLLYRFINMSQFCGGYLRGTANLSSQETFSEYLQKGINFKEFIENIKIDEKDFEGAKSCLKKYLEPFKGFIEESKNEFSKINKDKEKLFKELENFKINEKESEIESLIRKIYFLDGDLSCKINELKPKTEEEFLKYNTVIRKTFGNFKKMDDIVLKRIKKININKEEIVKIIKDGVKEIEKLFKLIESEYKEFMDDLEKVKLEDVLKCISCAKIDSFEKANPKGSNESYYDGKNFFWKEFKKIKPVFKT